jgi:hypothetical protein
VNRQATSADLAATHLFSERATLSIAPAIARRQVRMQENETGDRATHTLHPAERQSGRAAERRATSTLTCKTKQKKILREKKYLRIWRCGGQKRVVQRDTVSAARNS